MSRGDFLLENGRRRFPQAIADAVRETESLEALRVLADTALQDKLPAE